jgi:hypothetical protein
MSFFGTPFTEEEVEKGSTPIWEQVIVNQISCSQVRLLLMRGGVDDFMERSQEDFLQVITIL